MKTVKTFALLLPLLLAFTTRNAQARHAASAFDLLDLARPGLEEVARLHSAGDDAAAAEALLEYFRLRRGIVCPGVVPDSAVISADEQRWADEALDHRFFVHSGYQPSYFYGDDIDWQYWPVRDNELRWQLHRMKWWVPMGKAYRRSGDERYAAEWCAEYLDWIRKNPLTEYDESRIGDWTSADNVYFAWRPLEVSDRLEFQIHQFLYFLPARAFDGEFLMQFLENYHRHAEHIMHHFSASGNHLLFQAQRLLFAGAFFLEFRDAPRWRATGIGILNREMARQVYDDGMQYELDPHYHLESINIFFKALRMMDANGYRGEFPAEYPATIERMIDVHLNCSYPDGSTPLFSDNRRQEKEHYLACYREWAAVFPENGFIRCRATEGREGTNPEYLSRAFRTSGFYVLRNGWDTQATVMILKAGPQGFWHCQPDNGTFEVWHRGRNFLPDSGCYVYGGDSAVLAQRNWFRQTRVHNTLTLDGRNLETTDSKCTRWETVDGTDILTVENPSYEGLTHRRTVWFVDRRFFVIEDVAAGEAAGRVDLHYNLAECDPEEELAAGRVATRFEDGNNLLVQVFGAEKAEPQEGWVSHVYRSRNPRPAYAFSAEKRPGREVRFITVLLPAERSAETIIKAEHRRGTIRVTVDGRKYVLK
ncbi:heparin-sulfate lyase HepC [uncultured Alistipes sp.]|uniref:heparin-sulfate lyase HepC n=1 Tax=uncultured Alistipes sp. TaxID=538949 RepID=UPI00260CB2F5|nr:heparin-sulfate lyase HepC [uncultured Alistipes sp.]